MLLFVCAILPLFYGALAGPSADQYVDSVLFVLPSHLQARRLDRVILPDFATDFQDKIAIIGKVKGNANFTEGQLTGLSRVQRFSACGGPTYRFGASIINCTIAFQHLQTSYNGKMKYGKLPVVPIKGKANVTTTTVFFEVSSENQRQFLTKFYPQQMGQLETKFTGLGSPMNKFLKVLDDRYKAHVAAVIVNIIIQEFQPALQLAVSQVPMPR